MTARWAYRVGQVRSAHRARMSDRDRAEAFSHLGPELGGLFLRMAVRDQQHALRVLRRLDGPGPLLCQAALLHDVGKAEAPLGTLGVRWWSSPKPRGRSPRSAACPGWGAG